MLINMDQTIDFAKEIRKVSLETVSRAKSSHIGGALSMADLLAVLYDDYLKVYPNEPDHLDRDRFFLSKGHACVALYATLGLKGFYAIEELEKYTQNDSPFVAHTSHYVPGVELSTGSLGHALSVGCGSSLALKRQKRDNKVVVLVSDGELNEGSNWESILFAPQHKLDNLTLIVDYNKIQSFGNVADIIDLAPLADKFQTFNWNVVEIDGHNIKEIKSAFEKKFDNEKPKVVIANTIKGKGVDFMENELLWHYRPPNEEQLQNAIKQL